MAFGSADTALNPELPSLAEALVSLFGYSVLLSSLNTPIVTFWVRAHPVNIVFRLTE